MNTTLETKTIQKEISEVLYWIRGVAISLVVIGHVIGFDQNYGMRQLYNSNLGVLGAIGDTVNTIHMTTFFMVSGIATAIFSRPASSYRKFFTGKIARLLIPLVCWAPPFFIFQSLVKGREITPLSVLQSVIQPYEIFWFLHALMFAVTLRYLFEKLRLPNALYFGSSAILTLLSFHPFLQPVDIYIYWNGFFALGVVSVGWIYHLEAFLQKKKTALLVLSVLVLSVFVGVVSHFLPPSEYHSIPRLFNGIPGFLLFYITYHLSQRTLHNSAHAALHYIGAMSLIVYLFHGYFTRLSSIIISKTAGQILPLGYLAILSIVGIGGPLLLHHLILRHNRVLSYVTGGK
jgi:peptidoglycan/LPS O-acetylase OafA/YrhL